MVRRGKGGNEDERKRGWVISAWGCGGDERGNRKCGRVV